MQFVLDSTKADNAEQTEFARKHDWPKVGAGEVFLCAIDSKGNELGRKTLRASEAEAVDFAREFLKQHAPKQHDAREKWDEAFALAKETDRLVWVRTSSRYCGPCLGLTRWIDENRELLEREFVLLKIDVGNDLHGEAVGKRCTGDRLTGVPFFSFFDSQENLSCDSYSPVGNIGFMSGLEGKRHFRKMLETACKKITPSEIDELLSTLED